LAPIQDRLDDLRRQQRQPEHTTDIRCRAPRRIDHLSEDDGLNAAFAGSHPCPTGLFGDFPRSNGAISASRSSPGDLLPQLGHAVVAARRSSCTSRRIL
jgi:hypothetical protein